MYKAVLFDLGGVFTGSPFNAVEEYGQSIGCAPGQIKEIVFGSYDVDGDHPWHKFERGEISIEQTREDVMAIGKGSNLDVDIYSVFAAMAGQGGGFRPDMEAFVKDLKAQGLRIGMITNNVKEFKDGWRSLFSVDVSELFETIIDSSEAGVRKPEPAIYQLALKEMDLEAEHCIFLDDFQANVDAATALGLTGVLVPDDYHQAILRTKEILSQAQ